MMTPEPRLVDMNKLAKGQQRVCINKKKGERKIIFFLPKILVKLVKLKIGREGQGIILLFDKETNVNAVHCHVIAVPIAFH